MNKSQQRPLFLILFSLSFFSQQTVFGIDHYVNIFYSKPPLGEIFHTAMSILAEKEAGLDKTYVYLEGMNETPKFDLDFHEKIEALYTLLGIQDRIIRKPIHFLERGRALSDLTKMGFTGKILLHNFSENSVNLRNILDKYDGHEIMNSIIEKFKKLDRPDSRLKAQKYYKKRFKGVRNGVLLWNRMNRYQPDRNSTEETTIQIIKDLLKEKSTTIIMGDHIPYNWNKLREMINTSDNILDYTGHWKHGAFDGKYYLVNQFLFFKELSEKGISNRQLGVVSGVMDILSIFLGYRSLYLTFGDPWIVRSRIPRLYKSLDKYHPNFNLKMIDIAEMNLNFLKNDRNFDCKDSLTE